MKSNMKLVALAEDVKRLRHLNKDMAKLLERWIHVNINEWLSDKRIQLLADTRIALRDADSD
jgi:hypothetical protein